MKAMLFNLLFMQYLCIFFLSAIYYKVYDGKGVKWIILYIALSILFALAIVNLSSIS